VKGKKKKRKKKEKMRIRGEPGEGALRYSAKRFKRAQRQKEIKLQLE